MTIICAKLLNYLNAAVLVIVVAGIKIQQFLIDFLLAMTILKPCSFLFVADKLTVDVY